MTAVRRSRGIRIQDHKRSSRSTALVRHARRGYLVPDHVLSPERAVLKWPVPGIPGPAGCSHEPRFRFAKRFYHSIRQRFTIARLDGRIDPKGQESNLTRSSRTSGPAMTPAPIPFRQSPGAKESTQTVIASFCTRISRFRRSRKSP